MSHVFTVFFHGTAFDRDSDPNEVITQLSEAMSGSEARIVQTAEPSKEDPLPYRLESPNPTFLICEGPGSAAVSAMDSKSGVAHDRPGVFNPILNTDKKAGRSHELNPALVPKGGRAWWVLGDRKSSEFQDHFMGNTPKNWKMSGGQFLGRGWHDNVYKVAWLLTHLKWSEGMQIDTVNLVGWSRGGVTCLKTANKLFEVFEDTIDVNIFAIDPVPGGFNTVTDDIKMIPPNVRNYVGILAMDENGSLFEAMDRTTTKLMAPRSQHGSGGNPDSRNPEHEKPRVLFLPFPGHHGDVVNVGLSSDEVAASARIIRFLAWQFLSAHGTPFEHSFDMPRSELLALYESLMKNRGLIAKKARIWLAGKHGFQRERHAAKHRDQYVSDSETYLNEHHRYLAQGDEYHPQVPSEHYFHKEDWVPWNDHQVMDEWSEWHGGKMFDLPKEQSDLRNMGF